MNNHPLKSQIDEFISLTDEEFEFILQHFQLRNFKKHQIVLHEGDMALFDFFVIRGLMKISRIDSSGKEHILQFAMENWWITDVDSFHNKTKSSMTIDCMEETVALSLTLENKAKLCDALPKMQTFFLKKATHDYIALQKRILCFLTSNATDRYHNLISLYPGLLQRIPKTTVASYLGVSRETLSRLTKTV